MSLLFAAIAAISSAEITYRVTLDPAANSLRVRIEVSDTSKGISVQIPNWAPGSYRLVDNFRNVKNLTAKDGAGRDLRIEQVMAPSPKRYGDGDNIRTANNEICTWNIAPAASTVIEYDMASRLVDGAMHWSGPSTYMYVMGRINEPCRLHVSSPAKWPVYIGLDAVRGGTNEFTAPDYDVLADNPATVGEVLVDTYVSRGKPHYIVMRGTAKADVDREALIKVCKFVTDMQTDFFRGDAPYNHYVWHFNVNDSPDGAGGLEHLSSTQISLASGVGIGAISVISHEFFHLWNVKRIRSAVLGPFDYTKLPETGAIWWLEGVTDYYAHQLLYRYAWVDEPVFFADAASNITAIRRTPGLHEVSPYEASFRVSEAANGRGNSGGYKISYYPLGWVCGLLLDIELIERTQGRYRLDDIELALWDLCGDGRPGFAEDEIRKQLIRFGGSEMGKVYDDIIMTKGDKPIEAYLAKAGLRLTQLRVPTTDFGFTAPANATNGMVIQRLTRPSETLKSGDRILKIGGETIAGSRRAQMVAFAKVREKAEPGVPIPITVKRGEETLELRFTPEFASRMETRVEKMAFITPQQRMVRDALMKQATFRP